VAESTRLRVRLSGGPFDRALIFPPEGAVEAGMVRRGRIHLYEIKGRHGSYIGPRPMGWLEDSGAFQEPDHG
jgi:hypothetical protein